MKIVRASLMALLSAAVLTSCVKQQFDNPPDTSTVDPNLTVSSPVRALVDNALGLAVGKARIMGDTTIYGIVIGDDRSGNIYKQIIVQDTSGGGMVILLDKTNLYGDYPIGRKVYIKTKGLYLTNYKGLPEIAYAVDATGTTSGIPSALIGNYLVKGSYPNTVIPTRVALADLISNPYQYLNTLVTFDHIQFDNSSAGVLYSSASASTNRTAVGTDSTTCGKTASIVMYNSSYSTFQSALTPTGNGTLTGIVSIYISTPQFVLRDTTDIKLTGTRCPM